MVIRTVIFGLVGSTKKEISQEILELEKDLNDMHELKTQACGISGINVMNERREKINLITSAINRIESDLNLLRDKKSVETAFRSRANWFEYGEKSNEYINFLLK